MPSKKTSMQRERRNLQMLTPEQQANLPKAQQREAYQKFMAGKPATGTKPAKPAGTRPAGATQNTMYDRKRQEMTQGVRRKR